MRMNSHRPDRSQHRERHWPAIRLELGGLPLRLLKLALLHIHNIGVQTAATGQLAQALSRTREWPILDQPAWLLDDYGVQAGAARDAFEGHIFAALWFQFMAAHIRRAAADARSIVCADSLALAQELEHRAQVRWSTLLAADTRPPLLLTDESRNTLPQLAAFSMVAAACFANREADVPELLEFSRQTSLVLERIDSLRTIQHDWLAQRLTRPVQDLKNLMPGVQASPIDPVSMVGVLLLSGKIHAYVKECSDAVSAARAIAARLKLPTLMAHCDELDAAVNEVRVHTGLATPGVLFDPTFWVPVPDVLGTTIRNAEAYLLRHDPTLREAWDIVHTLASPVGCNTARPFPVALVIDILCQHGHDCAPAIDTIMSIWCQQEYRYHDQPDLIVPDADDLALALRMSSHQPSRDDYARDLEKPLRWMMAAQASDGRIPVWFRNAQTRAQLRDTVVLYGTGCATVETNLMISLIDRDWQTYREVVTRSAESWCNRWLAEGLGACEHYTPLYSLWSAGELIHRLMPLVTGSPLADRIEQVAVSVSQRLAEAAEEPQLSPQDSAFLILASLPSQAALPFDSNWVTTLFKHQRADGAWEGEPIYIVPNSRTLETQWFRSRAITTAFIYHALKQIQVQRAP
jgi:hypothetical protein